MSVIHAYFVKLYRYDIIQVAAQNRPEAPAPERSGRASTELQTPPPIFAHHAIGRRASLGVRRQSAGSQRLSLGAKRYGNSLGKIHRQVAAGNAAGAGARRGTRQPRGATRPPIAGAH